MKNYIYDCDHCGETIQALKEHMSVSCNCPFCNNSQIPAPSRQRITNQNVARAAGNGLGISVLVTLVIGGLFSGILPLLLGALLAFAMVVAPAWILTNLGTDLLFSNQKDYQDYRKHGSPFWDNFLTNRTEHFVLPNSEPDYNDFVPPGKWKYQCMSCKARVAGARNPCWYCGIVLEFSNEQRADEWLS
jgi:DNA-directed RNA polymerase subunit RPC12/RpoP